MKRILLLLGILFLVFKVQAQKSYGGQPALNPSDYAWKKIHLKTLNPLDLSALQAQDSLDDKNATWPRIAKSVQTNISLQNHGTWEFTSNGYYRVWQYKIQATDAKGMIFSFENFYLSPHSQLFIYDEDQEHVLGAFNHNNNPGNGYFAVGILKGDNAIIEVREPVSEQGQSSFTVYEVAQVYRLANPQEIYERDFGDADPCQVNVNCSPEGDNWQDEKKGVARILLKDGTNWGWCSGSLVNNTAQDCTPYFLTAHHCGETSSSVDRSQWIFYFDYESTGCSNGTNPIPFPFSPPAGSHTTIGCTQVAHSNDGGGLTGSDFKLLNLTNLSSTDILNWGLYFNGWDAGGSGDTTGVGIHHPSGDLKKISTYTQSLITTQWNGNGLNSHWLVQWDSTTNGHGVTEGGSSGSPIFNSDGLIVGTLTGGSSYCSTPNSPDMYGKMSYHWNQNTNPTGGHLYVFLDPVGSGTNTSLTGTYAPCSVSMPVCGISTSTTNAVVGQIISFTDASSNIPTSWSWDFGDSSPLDTNQNTTHAYGAVGTYTATLIASNSVGACTTTVVISVSASAGCDTLNLPPPGTLTIIGDGSGGYVAGSNIYGDLAKAQRFSSYSPYTDVTGSLFYFYEATDGGNGAIVRFSIWDEAAAAPYNVLSSVDVSLANLDALVPNGGNLIQMFFDSSVNVGGNPFYLGFEMIGFGAGDTLGMVTNGNGDPTVTAQAWEMNSGGVWSSIPSGWGIDIDYFISPYMTDLPPTLGLGASALTICEGDSVLFDASSSTNLDSLLWLFPGGSPISSNTTLTNTTFSNSGNEVVYLIGYGACGSSATDSVNITVNPGVSVTAAATVETCTASDGTITAVGTGGTGLLSYSTDNGTTLQSLGLFTGLGAGNYLVSVYDANGCSASTNVAVGQITAGPLTTATTTPENCSQTDGTIEVTALGAVSYSIDGGITFQTSNTFTGLTAGVYSIQITDINGCIGDTMATIASNNSFPSISTTVSNENCGNSDGSVTVSASGGTGAYNYSIDNGSTYQTSTLFSGLSSGSYSVIVQDSVGCADTGSVSISNIPPAVVSSVTTTDVSCNAGSDGMLIANATGGTLMYSLDGVTYQSGNTFTGLPAGNYTIYVDNGACIITDGPHSIGSPTAINGSATTVLSGCTVNMGEIDITANGGTPGYSYSIDCGSTFQVSPLFQNLAAGSYCIVIEDTNGCTHSFNQNIGSTPPINMATSVTNETCNNSNASVDVVASGGNMNYMYSGDGGLTFQTSNTISGLSAGTYNIQVVDLGGCIDSAIITITNIGGVSAATSGNQTICAGDPATISATGGASYNWFIGASSIGSGSSLTVTPSVTTTYTVIADDGMCFDTASLVVTVTPIPITTASSDTNICPGDILTLTASGGSTYSWPHSGETTASVNVSPASTSVYNVTAYNGTCAGNTVSVLVTVDPPSVAVASSNVSTTYLGSMGGQVIFDSNGSSGVLFSWDFGDGGNSMSASPTYSYTTPGVFTVVLTTILGNCTDTDTLIIIVNDDLSAGLIGKKNIIRTYPNPANNKVIMEFDLENNAVLDVTLTDLSGRLVYSSSFITIKQSSEELDVTSYADGYYILRITDGTFEHVQRISIVH